MAETSVYTIGIDIGGTSIRGGLVDSRGDVLGKREFRTPHDLTDAVAAIAAITDELRRDVGRGGQVRGIGISTPGYVDLENQTVGFAANLRWGYDISLQKFAGEAVGLPAVVENDANAAAWGEYRFGAGTTPESQARERVEHMMLVIVGTGVGSGLVLNGELYRGAFSQAGEVGHTCLVPDGHDCACGGKGCWEQYASGKALERYAREAIAADPSSGRRLVDLAGGTVESITGEHIQLAAAEGDVAAKQAYAELGHWMGVGLANMALSFDTERIVIGGGVSESGRLLLEPSMEAYGLALTTYHKQLEAKNRSGTVARIYAATLGNNAGLVGAANIALNVVEAAETAAPTSLSRSMPLSGNRFPRLPASGLPSGRRLGMRPVKPRPRRGT